MTRHSLRQYVQIFLQPLEKQKLDIQLETKQYEKLCFRDLIVLAIPLYKAETPVSVQ